MPNGVVGASGGAGFRGYESVGQRGLPFVSRNQVCGKGTTAWIRSGFVFGNKGASGFRNPVREPLIFEWVDSALDRS